MLASTLLRRPAVLLALGLCAIAAVTTLLGSLTRDPSKPNPSLCRIPLRRRLPRLLARWQSLAYSQRGVSKDDAFHLFVRRLPSAPRSKSLPAPPTTSAPHGRRTRLDRAAPFGWRARAMHHRPSQRRPRAHDRRISGRRRRSTAAAPRVSRDGKSLAAVTGGEKQPASIALIDIANGSLRRITNPPDGVEGDWSPALSPDGSTLAFTRSGASDGADIYVCDLSGGNLRRLTFDDRAIRGLAWTPGGADLVFAATLGNGMRLWRIAVNGGSPRNLFLSGNFPGYPAVSLAHNRLAYTESPSVSSVWRAPLDAKAPAGRPILRSSGREFAPSYSRDGKRIADISDQTGFSEIWVSDSEGGDRTQITSFKGPQPGRPHWSPDGKWLLFDLRRDGGGEVYKTLAEPLSKPCAC